MQGTIQSYVLCMADEIKKEPLKVKQYDTNSRWAKITLKAFNGEYWLVPFDVQIYINVHKADGTLATATCTKVDEHTVLAPITEQMTAVTGTQQAELYFLAGDGDIKSQTFPIAVYPMVMDQARIESSDDFQSLQDALRDVKASTDTADIAAQYATEQGNSARDAARQAENAAGSIQAAVDAAAAAKVSETNAKTSETAAAQTKQAVTDYVESQKAAFVGYSKRESDSKYANALTNSATGEGGITVEDAWTAPVLGLDVVGKSEQATTTGAQLLPQPQFNDTKNGITVKTQMDGGISITGTATSAIAFTVAEILLPAGTYILSGLSGLVVGRMYFQLVEISAQGGQFVGELAKVGPVASATVTIDRDVWARAEIKVLSGVTADSICYPMLNAGDTALPWEPYTGGAPSPSPDYPQDIISTGTVSTGKQMLNADTIVQGMVNAETGALSVTPSFVSSDFIPVKPGDYVLSGEGIKPYLNYVIYFDKEKVIKGNSTIKSSNGKFTVTEGITYARLRFVSKTGAEGTVTPSEVAALKPMLNAGDTALPWEPYTGGKPSPSVEYPQTLEVTTTGANLANITSKNNTGISVISENGEIKINGSVAEDHSSADIYVVGVYGSKIVRLAGINTYQIFGLTNDEELYVINVSSVVRGEKGETPITYNGDVTCIIVRLKAGKTYNNMVIRPMVSAGNTALPWEPYRSTSAAITLTEPLRGIGDYRDRIMRKDGEWGIERWITKLTLDGNEDWVIYGNSSYISFYTRNSCLPVSMNKREGLCEQLRVMTIGGKNLNTIWLGANNKVVYAIDNQFYDDTLEDKGLANWKAHLAESPLEIITYLDAPTWEPLPAATQQSLNELTTYAGRTYLTITAGGLTPDITLDYVQDTQKAIEQHDSANRQYTDNQIAAIVAALPTATQAAIVNNQTTKLLQEV